jgi:hypothetical protein
MGSQIGTSIETMRGASFNITMVFRKERIFEGIPHNSSVRIRIYDKTDRLVAAVSTSLDAGTMDSKAGFFADQQKIRFSGGKTSIPKGTKILEYRNLAGLYQYTELLTGPERLQALRRAQLYSPDYGIWGSIENGKGYRGSWTVKIDVVNWYLGGQLFHPAPAGLLQGESPALFSYNHLGPYQPKMNVSIPNTALGGHASIVIGLDLRAYVRGHIYSANWFDEMRTASWATIEMKKGNMMYRTYSLDGFYDAYLPDGAYGFRVSQKASIKGDVTANRTIVLSDGANFVGEDFFLETQAAPYHAHSCAFSLRCLISDITRAWAHVARSKDL